MKAFPASDMFEREDRKGMDLRDYFAAKALQGLLASDTHAPVNTFVEKAYEIADAMMKAREQ